MRCDPGRGLPVARRPRRLHWHRHPATTPTTTITTITTTTTTATTTTAVVTDRVIASSFNVPLPTHLCRRDADRTTATSTEMAEVVTSRWTTTTTDEGDRAELADTPARPRHSTWVCYIFWWYYASTYTAVRGRVKFKKKSAIQCSGFVLTRYQVPEGAIRLLSLQGLYLGIMVRPTV